MKLDLVLCRVTRVTRVLDYKLESSNFCLLEYSVVNKYVKINHFSKTNWTFELAEHVDNRHSCYYALQSRTSVTRW